MMNPTVLCLPKNNSCGCQFTEKRHSPPINNPDLNKYSGYNPETASDSFKILNMHIGTNEQAGLFGVLLEMRLPV